MKSLLLLLVFLMPLLPHPTSDAAEMTPPMQILRAEGQLTSISYLETEIRDVEESIFPAKLEISATLGRLHGILFYSIDKNDHQLVLKLAPVVNENKLIVRVGRMYYNLILADLCGCSRNCVYEYLNLTLETSASSIKIQCNGRPPDVRKYPNKYIFDRAYPRYKFLSNSTKNAVHLWMVNIPSLDGLPVEPLQVDGCIHAVRYRDRDVALTAIGPHIRVGCLDTCATSMGICNSGRCVGTLNDEPVCDCTAALLMGKTCTDKLSTYHTKTTVFKQIFSSLKVSWRRSINHRILLLHMSDLNITLSSLNNELRLQQKYNTEAGPTTSTKVLLHKYDLLPHTAIIQFLVPNISIQMPLDKTLVSIIPLVRNPESGKVKLTIYSQSRGATDAAYKYDDLAYEWTKVQWEFIPPPSLMTKEGNSTGSSNISKAKMTVLLIVLGSILAAVMVVVVAVLILIEARKRKREMEMLQVLQKWWRRWRRRRRDDPEKSAPLPGGGGAVEETSAVDDGAALWKFVWSFLRLYGDLKAVSKAKAPTDDDPQCTDIKFILYIILDDICRVGDLYQDRFVFGHWQSISSILSNLSSSSLRIGSDIDRLRKGSQKLILAIVNVAIAKSRSGPPTVARSAFVSTLTDLRSCYEEIKSIESSLGIDCRINAESESLVRDVALRCSRRLTSLIAGPIRGEAEYKRDEFVQRWCSQIEERIRKMGESAEGGEEWISQVRSLGGPIQSLMLAIVNVELREGGRSSGRDGPQIGSNVGESTSKRNSVSTSPNQE